MAKFALLATIYFFRKTVYLFLKYLFWAFKIHTTGTVKELKDKQIIYKENKEDEIKSTEYTYLIEINSNINKYFVDYVDVVNGDSPSTLSENEEVKVYFDVKNNRVTLAKKLKCDIGQSLLGFIISATVLAACFYLATSL